MGRYYFDQKQEADSLKKIQTWFLRKHGFFDEGWRSGTITWTNEWTGNTSTIRIISYINGIENYIRLTYTLTDRETGEQKDIESKLPLTTTPCNFGGKRFWFICSVYKAGVYCGKRVAVLYKGGDYFACRHCFELSYESRNMSKKYRDDPLLQVLNSRNKADVLQQHIKRRYYKGAPTRKYRRLLKLFHKEMPFIASLYKKRILTK